MNSLINQKLVNLGLSTDEVDLYMLLITQGEKTGTEIRSELNWGASKVDAIIYQLLHREVISANSDNGRILYMPASFEKLSEILIQKKEEQAKLEKQLVTIDFHKPQNSGQFKDAKILQYHGITGLKQVLWNTTKADGLIQGYEYEANAPYMDFSIMDEIRKVLVSRNIRTESIMNTPGYGAFTNVTEFLQLYECRFIDPSEIEFHHEIMIYNDVYTIFRADKNGIFCTEIYNQKLVDQQKQLFKYIWNRSQQLKMNPKGELSLIS